MCQPGRPGPMRRFPEMFAGLGRFPQSEIARVVFFVAIVIHARAGLHSAEINFRELAVIRKFGNAVIDGTFARIGEAFFLQAGDQRDHVLYMVGGAHGFFGLLQVQGVHVFAGKLRRIFRCTRGWKRWQRRRSG